MQINRIIIQISIAFIFVYLAFGVYLFINQKSMLYYPDNQDFEDCVGFENYQKINVDGTRMYFKQNSKDLIIYYHGNAGSACDRSYFKSIFERSNKSIIYVEYAGYSNDYRRLSRRLILQDVKNVHNFIKEKSFKNITIYGQSIGSGAASYHASLGNVDNLILVTPFSNLDEVVQSKYRIYPASIIFREKYDNSKWLKEFDGNILILHGDKDLIIPNNFSKKLYDNLSTENKEYFLIKGRGHNDIWSSVDFIEKLSEFVMQ